MTKHEYAEEVCKHLNKAGYETTICDNYRNNGSLVAITVRVNNSPVAPVFTIGEEDMNPEEFAKHILSFVPADISTDSLADVMLDKDKVLDRVSYILVNSKLNESRTSLVRRQVNKTLELHYKVDVNDILPGGVVTLEKQHIERLGIDEDELYFRAYENTMNRHPYKIGSIEDMVGCDLAPVLPIYVVTNDTQINGAGVILYKGMKEVLDDKVGEDNIIIPSSIHEWIVLPACMGKKEVITAMIQDVNTSVVSDDEVLSDRPYELVSDGMLFEL